MAPALRPAYSARERRELRLLVDFARRGRIPPARYGEAKKLVLEGYTADGAVRSIERRRPLDRP